MKKLVLALVTVAALSTVATAPAEARYYHHHGFVGPGLAFGLMAGAFAAAAAASSPYYYGPGYYDPYPYYPAYYQPYGYYGRPFVGPRFYGYRHRWHRW